MEHVAFHSGLPGGFSAKCIVNTVIRRPGADVWEHPGCDTWHFQQYLFRSPCRNPSEIQSQTRRFCPAPGPPFEWPESASNCYAVWICVEQLMRVLVPVFSVIAYKPGRHLSSNLGKARFRLQPRSRTDSKQLIISLPVVPGPSPPLQPASLQPRP